MKMRMQYQQPTPQPAFAPIAEEPRPAFGAMAHQEVAQPFVGEEVIKMESPNRKNDRIMELEREIASLE